MPNISLNAEKSLKKVEEHLATLKSLTELSPGRKVVVKNGIYSQWNKYVNYLISCNEKTKWYVKPFSFPVEIISRTLARLISFASKLTSSKSVIKSVESEQIKMVKTIQKLGEQIKEVHYLHPSDEALPTLKEKLLEMQVTLKESKESLKSLFDDHVYQSTYTEYKYKGWFKWDKSLIETSVKIDAIFSELDEQMTHTNIVFKGMFEHFKNQDDHYNKKLEEIEKILKKTAELNSKEVSMPTNCLPTIQTFTSEIEKLLSGEAKQELKNKVIKGQQDQQSPIDALNERNAEKRLSILLEEAKSELDELVRLQEDLIKDGESLKNLAEKSVENKTNDEVPPSNSEIPPPPPPAPPMGLFGKNTAKSLKSELPEKMELKEGKPQIPADQAEIVERATKYKNSRLALIRKLFPSLEKKLEQSPEEKLVFPVIPTKNEENQTVYSLAKDNDFENYLDIYKKLLNEKIESLEELFDEAKEKPKEIAKFKLDPSKYGKRKDIEGLSTYANKKIHLAEINVEKLHQHIKQYNTRIKTILEKNAEMQLKMGSYPELVTSVKQVASLDDIDTFKKVIGKISEEHKAYDTIYKNIDGLKEAMTKEMEAFRSALNSLKAFLEIKPYDTQVIKTVQNLIKGLEEKSKKDPENFDFATEMETARSTGLKHIKSFGEEPIIQNTVTPCFDNSLSIIQNTLKEKPDQYGLAFKLAEESILYAFGKVICKLAVEKIDRIKLGKEIIEEPKLYFLNLMNK